MAVPTYVSAGVVAMGTGDVSPVWGAGHATNDIGFLVVESAGGEAATLSVPAGFAEVPSSPQASGATTTGTRLTLFWCRAASGSMAAPTVQDTGNHTLARIVVYRPALTTGNPWNVTTGTTKDVASTSVSWPAVTTTTADCLIIWFGTHQTDIATAEFSSPSNTLGLTITQRLNGSELAGNGGGYVVYDAPLPTAGASGTTSATLATSSVNGLIALALASTASSTTYHGTASGGVNLAGTATGHALDHATASGGVDLAGAASGHALDHGAGTGGLNLAGAASGHAIDHATASGGLDVAGSAAGHTLAHGTASGGLDIAGTAAGHVVSGAVTYHGTAAGGIALAGAAAGHVVSPVVAPPPERTYSVPRESRTLVVEPESRMVVA